MKLEYKWHCPVCDAVLKTRKLLYQHQQEFKHYIHVPAKESVCPVCNKIFDTVRKLREHVKLEKHYKNNLKDNYEWICSICNKSFKSRRKLQKHRIDEHNGKKLTAKTIICNCQYCNIEFTHGFAKNLHEKHCELNPNRVECKGHLNSEETRQKISNTAKKNGKSGGYRPGAGYKNIKKGFYKGIWCDSSWELAFLIYCLEHNIAIKRNIDKFPYYIENKLHYYIPDFIIGNTYIEIKGRVDYRCKYKFEQFPNKQHLKIYYAKDMKCFLNYVYKKYGKNFTCLYDEEVSRNLVAELLRKQ